MEDPKSGDIPLVVSADGVALRLLKDCSDWMDKQNKARKIRRAGGVRSDNESNDDNRPPPAKSHKDKSSAPRELSAIRKPAKPSHSHTKKRHYEEVTDDSDRDDRHQRRKSTHQQGKVRRRDDWSSDEDEDDQRRRKKSKNDRAGDRRRDRDDGAKVSHRPAKSSKRTFDAFSEGSKSSDSDSD